MATFMLETLVLRGFVRQGELVVVLHGISTKANPQAPGIVNSMRHPLPDGYTPATGDPDVGTPTSGVTPGAGRSRHRFAFPAFTRCARSTGLPATRRWPSAGGQAPAAVATKQAIPARVAASVREVLDERLAGLSRGNKES